jgi:hypothetical protein
MDVLLHGANNLAKPRRKIKLWKWVRGRGAKGRDLAGRRDESGSGVDGEGPRQPGQAVFKSWNRTTRLEPDGLPMVLPFESLPGEVRQNRE